MAIQDYLEIRVYFVDISQKVAAEIKGLYLHHLYQRH